MVSEFKTDKPNKNKDFGEEFRKKLSGSEAIIALKQINNKNSADEFCSQGGDIHCILSVLPNADQSDMHVVLNALSFVIQTYLDEDDASECEQACHTLLTVYKSSILKAFNNHKTVVFKLLSAMVQVSFHVAKSILSIDTCLVFDKKDKHVRKDYIDLINSFLNDGNTYIIRTLLEKGILNNVISGLIHDEFTSVITILKTVTNKVVLNGSINKSLKMQVFNTSALNFLYGLYQWKGTQDQCELVRSSVHSLLIQLCTDYKKGIVFQDDSYGTSGQKLNPLIYNFIKKIKSPWKDELCADLIVKIFHACPDLVKPVFELYESSFEPRSSNHLNQLCSFLSHFISDFNIIDNLTKETLLMNIIKFKLFPCPVLNMIKKGITNKEEISKQEETESFYKLYLAILNKICNILIIVKSKFPHSHQTVLDYLQAELPKTQDLLKVWNDNLENCSEIGYLADVLLMYCNIFPLEFLPDKQFNLYKNHIDEHPSLYVKALQINSILFEPSIENIHFLNGISYILSSPIENFSEVFYTLLKSTHLFDHFDQELDIWHNAFLNIDDSKRELISVAFVAALENMNNDFETCLNESDDESNPLFELLDVSIDEIPYTPIPNMTTCLLSLLHSCDSQTNIEDFLNETIISLFHIQNSPKSFYTTIKQFLKLPKTESSVHSYIKSWSKRKYCCLPQNIYGQKSLESQFSKVVVGENYSELQSFLKKATKNKTKKNISLINCVQMSFFYATQSESENIIRASSQIFVELLGIIPVGDKQNIVSKFFGSPILSRNLLKDSMLLLPVLCELTILSKDKIYLSAYRKLLFRKLTTISFNKSIENTTAFMNLVITLGLNENDAEHLTELLLFSDTIPFYKKKKLTFWGELFIHILGNLKPKLSIEILLKFESVLILVCNEDVDCLNLQEAFSKYIEYHPYCVEHLNIDTFLNKIDSCLIVTLISIKPDIVSFLPKPKDIFQSLPIVESILNYSPLIGEKYISKVYKILETNLIEIILSPEKLQKINHHSKQVEYMIEKYATVETIMKVHDLINTKNVEITAENSTILTLLYMRSQDSDTLFIKLVKTFVRMSQIDRQTSVWIHKSLVQLVTKDSVILNDGHLWNEFVKVCLIDSLTNDHVLSLSTLTNLCEILPGKCHNNTFSMVISHSKFVQIMLSESELKNELVKFLNIFIKNGHVPLSSSHIPLFLSAYNATLSHTDQYLFGILQYYETRDIDMHNYKPFLWGPAAASYYDVSDTIMSKTLNRQPHPSQVTGLLLEQFIKRTVSDFPVNRQLIPTELHDNEFKKYDPSFLLPLLLFLLAPESPIQLNKFLNCGALAVVLSSLSSNDPPIRQCAYSILHRFHAHLTALRSNQGGLLEHFVDVVRNGIAQLNEDTEEQLPQLSNIVSIFLARSSLIISSPSHHLYSSLHKYFIAKPVLNLTKVPEFLVLFHSDNEFNREWILTIIRDGLNTLQDWILCDRTVIFKILFSFYSSSLCSKTVQSLICDIICKCLLIDKGRFYLIHGQGLLCWLKEVDYPISVLQTLSKTQKSDPNGLQQILLLQSLQNSQCEQTTLQIIQCMFDFVVDNNHLKNSHPVLFSNLNLILKLVEKHCGSSMVRESYDLQKYSIQYVLPTQKMSTMTNITYVLLSNYEHVN